MVDFRGSTFRLKYVVVKALSYGGQAVKRLIGNTIGTILLEVSRVHGGERVHHV